MMLPGSSRLVSQRRRSNTSTLPSSPAQFLMMNCDTRCWSTPAGYGHHLAATRQRQASRPVSYRPVACGSPPSTGRPCGRSLIPLRCGQLVLRASRNLAKSLAMSSGVSSCFATSTMDAKLLNRRPTSW